MSFLLDPPLLLAAGATVERLAPDDQAKAMADKAILATFLGISIGLYLDLPGLGFVWRPFRAKSGRDWMLNSGVFRCNYQHPSLRTHLASAAIFATYPFWLKLGHWLAKRQLQTGSDTRASGQTVNDAD
ncbi:MAG: hypothetical protein N2037_07250 [Acidimicrobiales bacterium]|nr:hypothetical protein [Acidimicrobiales bacterium]